jgi:hypothetical protein
MGEAKFGADDPGYKNIPGFVGVLCASNTFIFAETDMCHFIAGGNGWLRRTG